MKLLLGLGFALLLMLPNLRQVSTQESREWIFDEPTPSTDGEMMAENSAGLSGDGEHFFLLNQTSEDPTTEEPENEEDSTTLPPPPHVVLLNSSKDVSLLTNKTSTKESKNNTTSINNSTTASPKPTPTTSNHTGLNNTTLQPKINSTVASSGSFPSNVTVFSTFHTQNSTTGSYVNSTTAYPPHAGNTTARSTSTAGPVNATTVPANTTIPVNTTIPYNTTVPDNTTDLPTIESTRPNRTGVSFDMRGNSERGVSSDFKQNAKSQAWGAIVGIGVAVGFVALVVYVIMKRKSHRDFSHRKLVEDMRPDPVLRLDNSEPLDLKYDGSGYYNPGVQGDNIQMTNFPRGHSN